MVDSTDAMESRYLTADLVRESPTKIISFLDEGLYEETDYGKKLTLLVEIDGKQKIYRPNRDSVSNFQVFGKDTMGWLGKQAKLQLIKIQGKDSILGLPISPKVEEVR